LNQFIVAWRMCERSVNYLTFGNEQNEQSGQQTSSSSSSASDTKSIKMEVIQMFKDGHITKDEMMEMMKSV
jgi:hypothetical protein